MNRRTRVPERVRRVGARQPYRETVALAAAASALATVSVVGAALGWGASMDTARSRNPAAAAPRGGTDSGQTRSTATGAPPATSTASTAAQALGANTTVPTRGSGRTKALAVPGADSTAEGRTVRYTVEVEDGTGIDEAEYTRLVRDVLTDKRGWETQDQVHFVNISPDRVSAGEEPDVRITLATPDTVDELCAPMTTEGQVSCSNGDRVALNAVRWEQGVPYYPNDLLHYRIYLINHEVGHAIGHDHEACAGPGKPAPVMLQQTLGLQGCTRYPWPVPGQAP